MNRKQAKVAAGAHPGVDSWIILANNSHAQPNSISAGLGPNWTTVTSSPNLNQLTILVSGTPGSVFFRLIYP